MPGTGLEEWMRYLRTVVTVAVFLTFLASAAFSQAVSASIVGTITDATGAVIPNAKVTVSEVNTGVDHSGLANASGNYTFVNVPPGTYRVAVEREGFKKEIREGVDVVVDSTTRVDMQLRPGNVSETIDVTAEAAVLKTDRADITSTVEQVQIEELPNLFNGNYQLMLSLVPGISEPTEQHSQFFNASSSVQMNAYGQPRMANNYQIEGIDNNERTGLLQIMIPPKEAIQQVNVSTSNHDPELGRGTGAVSNVVLKSGTNVYHGAAYWNVQNSGWDTRSFFNPSVGHVAYNQVGGNIGGPIRKNKLFYFADYLKTMDHEANTNLVSIPSMDYRTGNFSADTHLVYDPATGNPLDINGADRQPFPANIVPADRINPVSAKLFALMPAPNMPYGVTSQQNDYFSLLPAIKTTDHMDAKVDYQYTDKDRFSVRFSYGKPTNFQAPIWGDTGGGPAPSNSKGFEGSGVQRTYSTGLNYDRMVTPTLITQMRVGVAYYNNVANPSDYGTNDSTNLGIPGANINAFTSGMTEIDLGGFTTPTFGYSNSLPWVRAETNIDFVNTWTKLSHNHNIKWGVDIRRLRDCLLQDQTFGPRGLIKFGASQTSTQGKSTDIANDVASMLLDVPSEVARDVNTYFPSLRATQIFSFIADQWQISPRLTASLGLRWELYPPFTPEHSGGFSNYDPFDNTLVIAGVGGNLKDLGMVYDKHYLAPRVGLAYRLTSSTVVRSGFGLSYTSFPDNTYAYNYPVRSNNDYQTYQNASFTTVYLPDGRPATFQNGFPAPLAVPIPASGVITSPDPTQAYFYIPLDYKNPYVLQWNFAVQQALPAHLNLDVAYVGSHGVDTGAQVEMNPGLIVGAAAKGQPYNILFGRTTSTKMSFQGFTSTFNSLQAKFDRRFSSGLIMTTAFTWQKAMDYQSGDDGGLARWYINPARNYARADFDRTLNVVQSYIYRLPFGKGEHFVKQGPLAAVIGGWQVTSILTARTGSPITLTDASSLINAPINTETPNQIGPIVIDHGINTFNPWIDRSGLAHPATGTWGTMGRAVWSGPGQFRLDAGVSRWINVNERWRMQIRGDSYDVTNTPFFSNPNTDFSSSSAFGYVTSTVGSGVGVNGFTAARSIQLALKIQF
jgi:hypothetical protein